MRKIFLLLLLIPALSFGQNRWFSSSTSINIISFGASAANSDNRAAIIAARDYIYSNPVARLTLYIPKGVYQVSDSIKFDKTINILGEGTIGESVSELVFPAGKKGLIFSYQSGENGFGAEMRDVKITGQFTSGYNNTSIHAITIRTRVKFENVIVSQFDGDGFHISACGTVPNGDNNNFGIADNSVFNNCAAFYCTNGMFTEGCDGHIMAIRDCDFSQNRRWGYYGNAISGDMVIKTHFAFDGVAVPGAKSVVTYSGTYYVAKAGYDGYWNDATDSNYNKQPNTNPDYWLEVTPTMEATAWANNVRYYSGGPAIVKNENAVTSFINCYTEGSQPPLIANYRVKVEGGQIEAGVVGGAYWRVLYGEQHLNNAGLLLGKYLHVGTTTYDAAAQLVVKNTYSETGTRSVFKGEGTSTEVYLDLKNNTGKYARFAYVDSNLKIYVKNDSLGLNINDEGVTAKKFFGDGSALTGLAGGGDMVSTNNLSDVANVGTARNNLGLGTLATQNGAIADYLTSANAASTYQPIGTYATASNAMAFTNKTGNISQWTNDASYLVAADISGKANIASPTFTGTVGGITASMVGLGNVTNESKATMFASPTFTGTVSGVTASMVGLGNVDNTSNATERAATATLTNKTISGASNTLSNIGISSITGYTGYTLSFQALTSSPTDAQTIYFGMLPKAPTSTANISKIYIRKAGTIKVAELYCYSGTAGTNESWSIYIRVNNTTDNLIATVSSATSERVFSNTGLSISVNVGDYIEIKSVNPTWATNPLTTIFGGYVYIE